MTVTNLSLKETKRSMSVFPGVGDDGFAGGLGMR